MRFTSRPAGEKEIINEHGAMRNKAIVADRHQITDKRVGLNPASLPDLCSLLYLDEWSDERVVSNGASVEVNGLNHSNVFTKLNIDNPYRPKFRSAHTDLRSPAVIAKRTGTLKNGNYRARVLNSGEGHPRIKNTVSEMFRFYPERLSEFDLW